MPNRGALVITGADVYVGRSDHFAKAVGIKDGRIVAVGTEADVRSEVANADHLHLPGKLLLPGFQDAHVHPILGGKALSTLWLDGTSRRDYLQQLANYRDVRRHPGWVVGHGWSMEHFPDGLPSKHDLDAIFPDRPVFLTNREYHSAWVNSVALERAGISREIPDPWDGRVERDPETGEPTGAIHEGVVMAFLDRHIPQPSRADREAWLLKAQVLLHSLGITAWQDAWVNPGDLDAYLAVASAGKLTARVNTALWWDRHRGIEQIDSLLESRERTEAMGCEGLRASAVKLWIDGIVDSRTGAMLEPYRGCQCRHDDRGLVYIGHAELARAVARLDSLGFQAHMHAIGDRAVRYALDACEAARSANGPSGNRHHIAHLQVVHPDDITRFAALGVSANCQTFWAQSEPQMEQLTRPLLGDERYLSQFPFGDLMRAGTSIAMGSDWPVTTADPLDQLQVAVTRTTPEQPEATVFASTQQITLQQAVTAATSGSAFVNHDDHGGLVARGRRADITVLDRNIFKEPQAARIGDAAVDFTLAAGRIVYENPRLSSN